MKTNRRGHMGIFEVLSYGPIVAEHEEFGLLITANASYLNLWVAREFDGDEVPTRWENTDARAVGDASKSLDALKISAERWVAEILSGDESGDEETTH